MNDLIKKIAEKYSVKKTEFGDGVYFYDVETPAVKFRHYLSDFGFGDRVFCFSQKGEGEDEFAAEVISALGAKVETLDPQSPISTFLFNGKSNPSMDRIMVLGAQSHRQFMSDVSAVYPNTYVVFPYNHTEFRDDDVPDDIHFARGKLVNTLDWFREPQPRVCIWFELVGGGGRMHTDQLHMTTLSFLEELLTKRVLVSDGVVKIERNNKDIMELCYENGVGSIEGEAVKNSGEVFGKVLRWLKE